MNRLSEELNELREFINDEDYRIKTLEYKNSKLEIKRNRLLDKRMVKKEELTDEEDNLYKEINTNYLNKFHGDNLHQLKFDKQRVEVLKKYLKEQVENLTDLFNLKLI